MKLRRSFISRRVAPSYICVLPASVNVIFPASLLAKHRERQALSVYKEKANTLLTLDCVFLDIDNGSS